MSPAADQTPRARALTHTTPVCSASVPRTSGQPSDNTSRTDSSKHIVCVTEIRTSGHWTWGGRSTLTGATEELRRRSRRHRQYLATLQPHARRRAPAVLSSGQVAQTFRRQAITTSRKVTPSQATSAQPGSAHAHRAEVTGHPCHSRHPPSPSNYLALDRLHSHVRPVSSVSAMGRTGPSRLGPAGLPPARPERDERLNSRSGRTDGLKLVHRISPRKSGFAHQTTPSS